MNVGCNFQASDYFTKEAVVLDLAQRKWGRTNTRGVFIDSNKNGNMFYQEKDIFFKDLENIPKYILPYYKGIRHEYVRNSGRHYWSLMIEKPIEKFEVTANAAFSFARYIADKMPENVEDLSSEIVTRFTNVIDKEKGYDISVLFIVATKTKTRSDSYFGNVIDSSKYLVMDRFMNPIDVKAFYEVMDKIIVKK